jgi:hypothetical protein
MIGTPCVERPMQRPLVVEIAVAAIHRQLGRCDRHQDRARPALFHMIAIAGGDDDDFVAEARGGANLRFDIGPHTAA